jgi:hypothetical protein
MTAVAEPSKPLAISCHQVCNQRTALTHGFSRLLIRPVPGVATLDCRLGRSRPEESADIFVGLGRL